MCWWLIDRLKSKISKILIYPDKREISIRTTLLCFLHRADSCSTAPPSARSRSTVCCALLHISITPTNNTLTPLRIALKTEMHLPFIHFCQLQPKGGRFSFDGWYVLDCRGVGVECADFYASYRWIVGWPCGLLLRRDIYVCTRVGLHYILKQVSQAQIVYLLAPASYI